MSIRLIKCIVTPFFCLFVFHSFAQNNYNKDSLISSKISDLISYWTKYNNLSNTSPDYENYSVIPALYSIKSTDSIPVEDYHKKLNDAKIKRLKQDLGLQATANYLENFDPGFNSEDNLIYNSRFQTGLDWNMLADGLVSNHYKQQILKNESIIQSLLPKNNIDGNAFISVSHKIIFAFNIHKIKLLQKRQQIIDDKIAIANELYLLKHLPRVDLLHIMQQQVDVGSMNQIYKSYNEQLSLQINEKDIPQKVLPVFDIDIAKAFSFSKNQPGSDSILKLQIENIHLAHKPLSDIRLNTQFKYNYYNLINSTNINRSFASASIGLAVPIPLGFKANKNVVAAQSELLAYQNGQNSSTNELDLLNAFYEFRYKHKQYNNQYEKRKQYEELIRVERVKEKFDDLEFNPLHALNLLDELLAIDIELLDLQQQMYLQLLDITSKIPGSEAISFVKPFSLDTVNIKQEQINKALYVWSEAQTKYSAEYIEEYISLNHITTAIISLRKDQSNKVAALNLIAKLASKGVYSELLFGNNKLLTIKDPNIYFDSLISGVNLSNISALHLDVEPHVLKDFDTQKDQYLIQYVDLLKKAKTYCIQKGLKLMVSIPVFYPENILKEIYAHSDLVYIMAYEHPNAEYIIKKLKEEFGINKNKTVIALRAKDFKNRTECEKLITEISTLGNVDKFALHDLESFVNLDELSIDDKK